jgi:hypothetical protein
MAQFSIRAAPYAQILIPCSFCQPLNFWLHPRRKFVDVTHRRSQPREHRTSNCDGKDTRRRAAPEHVAAGRARPQEGRRRRRGHSGIDRAADGHAGNALERSSCDIAVTIPRFIRNRPIRSLPRYSTKIVLSSPAEVASGLSRNWNRSGFAAHLLVLMDALARNQSSADGAESCFSCQRRR